MKGKTFDFAVFDDPFIPPTLNTVAKNPVPEASNTFYAIYGLTFQGYIAESTGKWDAREVSKAKQFSTVPSLLNYINEGYQGMPGCGFGSIEIRRVTRSTTPGTTSRRILDHGEQAPAGSVVRFIIWNGAASKPAKVASGAPSSVHPPLAPGDSYLTVPLEEAVLFNSEAIATQFQQPQDHCWRFVRRVALLTTSDAKVTYKEEVVQ